MKTENAGTGPYRKEKRPPGKGERFTTWMDNALSHHVDLLHWSTCQGEYRLASMFISLHVPGCRSQQFLGSFTIIWEASEAHTHAETNYGTGAH